MKEVILNLAKGMMLLLLWAFSVCLYAQAVTVKGTVTDAKGEPLIGVSVQIQGTTAGTVTDAKGKFILPNVPSDAVLEVSYVGMLSQTVALNGKTTVNIVLQEDTEALEEVVVIGYQTVKKSDLTGAVAVVDTKAMEKSASGTIANQLQGLATGVNVRSTGKAGADASIEIRGVGSLSDNSPLWVVDGMILNPGVGFNPNDIETIQILKDASAAAIYGSRAANGVIIVTTKKGKDGPMKVNFSARETLDWSPKYDLMNASEYKKYNDMAYKEGIKDGAWSGSLQQHSSYDTDWQKEVFRTAFTQDYNVSLSGGSKSGSYFVSGNYYGNEGVSYGNSFDRYTFRVNTEGKKGIFSFGENLGLSYTDTDPLQTNPYNDMLRMLPTIPVYDENNPGGYGYGDANANTFGTNPIAREDLEHFRQNENRINGNAWLELKPFQWLSYKLNAGIDYYFYDSSWFRGVGNWTRNQEYRDSESKKQRDNTFNRLIEHTLNFDHNFGEHSIDAVIGTSYQNNKWSGLWASRLKFPQIGDEYLTVLDAGTSNQMNSNSEQKNAIISYLGRLNYIYADKYYFTATFRRDGTSRLSKNNRWGNFPSFSGAWRISKESFFDVPWVSDLKIRANWGRLGNSAIGNWDYLGTINQSLVTVIGGQLVSGATQVKIVNENLRWETKETTNLGFDASFFNQHLLAGAEYYIAKTNDVLTSMPIAAATGNDGGAPVANAASLKNQGFEFNLGWRYQINDFKFGINANFTTINNRVIDLGYGKDTYINGQAKSSIGQPLSMFYLYKTDGIFHTQQEIDDYVNSKGEPIYIASKRPQLGDVRYINTDDDTQITANDRQIVGNPWPDFQLGMNFTAEWKNFDFSMMWYGQFGNDVYNVALWQGRYFSDNSNYIRFKKGEEPYQENPNSNTPRIIYGDTRNGWDSDRFIENGSYFRMKNIQLGYTFSERLLKMFGVEKLRLYLTGSNLITITPYSGLDPDFVNTNVWNRGTNGFDFPNMRSVQFGLDLSF